MPTSAAPPMPRRHLSDRARAASLAALMAGLVLPVAAADGLAPASPSASTSHPAGANPHGGHGLEALVADTYDQGAGFVQPVCLANGHLGPRIAVGGQPFAITLSPVGHRAYVANSGWGGPKIQTTVTPINLITDQAAPAVPAGLGPMGIAVTPDGSRAYVADMGGFQNRQTSTMTDADTLTPIDLNTDEPLRPISVGPGVGAVSITPDGTRAVVAIDGTESHPLSYIEVLTLATRHLSEPITVGAAPMAIAITPNGKEALVTDTGFNPIGHTVTPVNLVTRRAGRSIPVGTAPIDIVLTPNGKTAYVANTETSDQTSFAAHGTVSTIDVATDRAGRPITVPGVPQSLAIAPDGTTVYEVGMERFDHSVLAAINGRTGRVTTVATVAANLGAVAVALAPAGTCP